MLCIGEIHQSWIPHSLNSDYDPGHKRQTWKWHGNDWRQILRYLRQILRLEARHYEKKFRQATMHRRIIHTWNVKTTLRSTEKQRKTALHRKWNFPLRIFLVNVTKSTWNWGFCNTYRKYPKWKSSFFVQCSALTVIFWPARKHSSLNSVTCCAFCWTRSTLFLRDEKSQSFTYYLHKI